MKKIYTFCGLFLLFVFTQAQTITVTYPNGGETFEGCSNKTITWTESGVTGGFNVYYSTNNGISWASLTTNYIGTSYSFTVPNISTTQALVLVTSFNDSLINDVSNSNFTITPALIITQPNGGENWQVGGGTQNIIWNGYGTSNSFLIEYSVNGGSSWSTVYNGSVTPVGNTYTRSWTIPNNPSTFCLIRVTDNNAPSCKNDVSDNIFTIVPATPVINVTSPNGGNTLYIGQSHPITWTSAFLSGSFVNIAYSTDNGVNWTTIINSTNNTGSYTWTNIPNTPSNNCLVKISDAGNPSTNDISDAVFSIALGTLTVTYPNGGENLNGCQSYNITWTRTGTSNYFNIDYSTDNGITWNFVASNYYQTGTNYSYAWSIPNISSSQALVRVYDYNNNIVKDSSNAVFSINPAITVSAPNGGEIWQGGTSQVITWQQGTGASNYWTIRYSIDAGNSWTTIVSNTYITNGQYTWSSLPNLPSANCLIQVYDHQNASCRTDVSNNLFSITPATPVITVSSPNGGNTFYVGTAYNITWTSQYLNSPFVVLDYSIDNGATWINIVNSTNNDGIESWIVPNTPSSQCLVRVSEYGAPTVYDVSNAVFNIVYPYVIVTSPNGGESWEGCSQRSITWTGYGAGNGPWRVQYSDDNGLSWSNLTNSTTSTSYSWSPVPNNPSSNYLVKITRTTDANVTDVSDANFSVTLNTAIVVNTPNGGENWEVGAVNQLITWSWAGTSNYYNLYYSIDSGATWLTIATNQYITNGQFAWNMPNNPSTKALVKIEDKNNTCKYDISDAVFSIIPPQPSITVNNPNGGNTFYVGTAYNITWSSAYLSSNFVTIDYSIDNGSSWNTIFASTSNDGLESWTVPNTPSNTCLIRISEFGNPSVFDISNNVFTIRYPFVAVTNPNGDESFNGCSSQSISWTSYGAGNGPWKVEYSVNNGSTWTTLINSTTSSSYNWNPVPNTPTTQAFVKVTKTTDPLVKDTSDLAFTITQNTAIVITSPNGGESWQVANPNSRLITWTSTGVSNYYNLYYSLNNGQTWTTIASNLYITNNQYLWTIPNMPSNQVLVMVEDRNNTCKFDVSDAIFEILAPEPIITVTAPNGGNTYYVGTSYNITWSSQYLTSPFVVLDYSVDNGSTWINIVNSTNNDGIESWVVPNTPSSNCLIRVSEFGNPLVYDISDAVFNIVYPYVVVTSPNGGESWEGCSSRTITWTGYGASNGPWRVQYSNDNGLTWITLTNSTTSSSYTWNPIPNNPGSNYLVKVTRTTDPLVTDVSNANFSVTLNTAIVLNTPNGGENWQVGGSTQLITWAWAATSNSYNFYYSIDNGINWITIASNQYITTGQYAWVIPNNPSNQVLVKVEDYNNPCKFDISDNVFTISAPVPYITVLTPNGGNTFYVGTAYNIVWTAGYLSSNFVTIEYSINNGSSWTTIFASTANDGSESWVTPNTPSANCLIRVSEYGNPAVSDVSDNVFNIVYPYIVITTPNGGESINGCAAQTINWLRYGTGTGPWKIEYTLNNGQTWHTIINSTTSSSYSWNPVPNTPSTQAKIRITKTTDPLVTDISDAPFTVTPNTAIVITSPNGSENWQVANPSSRLITWTSSGVSNYYSIYYSVNNGQSWNNIINNQYITSNQYAWTIPNNPSGQVLVKVEDYNNTCKFDISDAVFTIQPPTPIITVTAPNGGNTFYVGASYNITWSSQYLSSSFVKLEYSTDNGAIWSLITSATPNDGSETWFVPNTPSSQCLVRVSEYGNPSVYDISDNVFNIVTPYISVNIPNAGESWTGCTSQTIFWSGFGTGNGPYRVEYSTNNGSSWSLLTNSTTSSSFTWNPLPNITTSQALIRVSLTNNATINDISDVNFNINEQSYIVINSPNGGEEWQVANPSTRTITWASSGVSNYYNIYYSLDGGINWNTIVTNQYITNNQYNWTLPNVASNNVLIMVEDRNNTCKFDISDVPFTILAPTPVITVATPNGGQTLYAFNNYTISWTSAYLTSSFVKIEFSVDSGATWMNVISSTNNTGSYIWNIPNIETTKAFIRITDFGNNATYDESNAIFTIKPAVKVIAPNGDENLGGCTMTTITWQGESSSQSYNLQYSTNGGNSWTSIVSQTFTGGPNFSYNWTLPNMPSNYCLVKVTHNSNANKTDISNGVFKIEPTITVTNPNNGGSYAVGSTLNITWAAQGVSNYYNIDYSTNGGSTWNSVAFNQYITTNSYNWTIPATLSTNCLIRVRDNNNTCKQGITVLPFTIANSPASITVTSPNGAENWQVCSERVITWSANNTSGAFNIDFSADNGSTWVSLATNYISANGNYTWTLPNTPTTQGLIKVSDNANSILTDQSNAVFAISVLSTPSIISGNTTVCQGTTQTYSVPLVTGATSYTWQLPSGWTGVSTSNTINCVVGNTGGQISVVANNACSQSNASNLTVAVTTLPDAPGTISGNSTPCSGISQTYSIAAVPNATSYSWLLPTGYSGVSTTNSINVLIGNNAGNIIVYGVNACGTGASNLFNIIPNGEAIPQQPNSISGKTIVCANTTETYSITPVAGATSYTWTLPSGWSGTSNTHSITAISGTSGGIISVVATNACGTSTAQTLSVSIKNLPNQPFAITGNTTVCQNSSNIYSISNISSATSYTWTLPNAWTGVSNTTAINTVASAQSGNVQVVANNECGASVPRTLAVTVNAPLVPSVSIVSSPTGGICGNTSVTFNATAVNGGTPHYQWVRNNLAVGTNSPIYTASNWNVNDSVWVLMSSGLSCVTPSLVTSNKIALNVTPVVVPSISISTTSTSICAGENVTFETLISGGGTNPSYQWRKNGANIIGANNPTYTTNDIINGEIYSCVLTSNANCASPVSVTSNNLTMSVSNNFAASVVIAATPNGTVCSGTNVSFTANPANGGSTPTYEWTVNGVLLGTGSSFASSLLNNNDTVRCMMTSSLSCVLPAVAVSNSIIMTVNQNVNPEVTIQADNNPICMGQLVTYTATPINGGTNPLYQWRKNNVNIGGANAASYATSNIDDGDIFDVILTSNYNCIILNKDTSNAIAMFVSSSVTPSVSISVNTNDTICAGTTAVFTATPLNGGSTPSYQWKKNGIDIIGANASSYTSNALVSGEVITVEMTSSASCASPNIASSNAISMVVYNNTIASVSITANPISNACAGASVLFSTTTVNGGLSPTYQWYLNGAVINGANTSTYETTNLDNGDQINVQMTTNKPCASPITTVSNTITYNISDIPAAPDSINGTVSTCQGVQLTYAVPPVSGATSYNWTLPNGWTGSSTSSAINVVAGPSSGNITVTAENSCGVSAVQTLYVSVSPLPIQPQLISGATAICAGTNHNYSIDPVNFATSYTWTLPLGWTGTSLTESIGVIAGTTSGNITVKANNACGSSSETTLAVTVSSVPSNTNTIVGSSIICSGSTQTYSIPLVNGATTYTWTLPSGWSGNSTTESITTTSNNNGGNVTVVANNLCGSSVIQSKPITVNSIPSTPGVISGNTSNCEGVQSTYSILPVGGASSYIWTLPTGWSGTSTNSSIQSLSSSQSGTITVAASNSCGISQASSLSVTVNPLPTQPSVISGNSTTCYGTQNTYTIGSVNNATSYTWTLPTGWTGSSTGTSIDATTGATGGTISVKANNSCGSSIVQTLATTVSSVPPMPAIISGNSTVCSSTSQTYTIASVNGASSYTWNLPSGWSGASTTTSITTTANNTGGTITVTANNSCGSSAAQSKIITVNSLPQTPALITGNTNICEGTNTTYTVAPVNDASFYTWQLPSGWVGTSTTNSINIISGSTNGNVSVTAGNACGNSQSSTLSVTVSPIPTQPGAISGNTSICSGTSNTYSISPVNNATSYTWILPSGWQGSSSNNSIDIISSTVSGNITVTAHNQCGTSTFQVLGVNVLTTPIMPVIINGNNTICEGTSNTYSIMPVMGATSYTWTLPVGWSGMSNADTINTTANTTGGIITVTASNICGTSMPQTLSIAVNNIPGTIDSIIGNSSPCIGVSENYTCQVATNATSYTWVLPSGFNGSSNTNSIYITTGANPGIIEVYASNACGQGPAATIFVSPNGSSIPAQPANIIGTITPCLGSSETYSIQPVSGATSYTWTAPNGWTGSSNTHTINYNVGQSNGLVSVSASNACGTSTPTQIMVYVNILPENAGAITGAANACANTSQTYSIYPVSGASSYIWTLPSGWIGTSTTHSIDVTFDANSGDLSVTAQNNCGLSDVQLLNVTVHNPVPPTINVNGATLTSSYLSDNQWYFEGSIIPGAVNQTYTVIQNGEYYVIYTDTNGCQAISNSIHFVWVGADNIVLSENMTVYPNPNDGRFSLKWEGSSLENVQMTVYNSLGENIFYKEASVLNNGETTYVDIPNAVSGIYLLHIYSNKGVIVHRIVVHQKN